MAQNGGASLESRGTRRAHGACDRICDEKAAVEATRDMSNDAKYGPSANRPIKALNYLKGTANLNNGRGRYPCRD